jgi:hypothetical protein
MNRSPYGPALRILTVLTTIIGYNELTHRAVITDKLMAGFVYLTA